MLRAVRRAVSVVAVAPAVASAQFGTLISEQTYYGCNQYVCNTLTWTVHREVYPPSYTGIRYLVGGRGTTTVLAPLLDRGFTRLEFSLVSPGETNQDNDPGYGSGFYSMSLIGAAPGAQFSWGVFGENRTAGFTGRTIYPSSVRYDAWGGPQFWMPFSVAVTVTPEPSTWTLLGTGLLAVGGIVARRHGRRSA
jgi:hypothetical protein